MRLAPKRALIALGAVAAVWLVFSWFEAEKELRILCSDFHSALEREHVVRTLETGAYLRYRTEADADDPTISVDSFYNLGSSRSVIAFEAGRVVSATYE
jgi:hypothetical protein